LVINVEQYENIPDLSNNIGIGVSIVNYHVTVVVSVTRPSP